MNAAASALIHRQRGGEEGLDRAASAGCVCDQERALETPLTAETADDLPIVLVEDDDPLLACGPSASSQAYLRSVGLTDPATWAAFRLGQFDPSDRDRAGLTGIRLATGTALDLPTFDPRDPERVLGLIRMTEVRHRHRFITDPVGLAGPLDLRDQAVVVLVDTPLLGLRLHQAGVRGAAVVEDPQVLPALLPWLSTRTLVLASHRHADLETLRRTLGPLGEKATRLVLPPKVQAMPASTWELLGVRSAAVVPSQPAQPPPIPSLLRDLAAFAQERVRQGSAQAALRHLGLDDPGLVTAYHMGFLPDGYEAALSGSQRLAIGSRRLGGTVLLPACDGFGTVIDLLLVHPDGSCENWGTLPCGLLAPALVTAHERLIITDKVLRLAQLARQGHAPVLLLRGLEDARCNVGRLVAGGVRQVDLWVEQDGEGFAAVLRSAGLTVQATDAGPAPLEPILFPVPANQPAGVNSLASGHHRSAGVDRAQPTGGPRHLHRRPHGVCGRSAMDRHQQAGSGGAP